MSNKRLDNLSIPLIQGGMGVGISLSNLAGAVMKEGGMGVISAAHPGYRKENFWQNSKECNVEAIIEEVHKAKQLSNGSGLCAVNVMVASRDYETYVNACVEAGADAIISGAGLPLHLPEIVKDEDIMLAPIVSSGKAASLILRSWQRHSHRLPDFIVIEGALAGGHLGFKKEELLKESYQPLDEILKDVLEVIEPYEKEANIKIPVFVAGGVYTALDIQHYQSLGAYGVQMGTRFIATKECDADERYKEMFVNARKEDIALVKSPAGLPGRAILTPFMSHTQEQRVAPSHCIGCMLPCHPEQTPYCISEALIHAVQGDVEHGLVFAGSNAYRINKIVSVKELIDELFQR